MSCESFFCAIHWMAAFVVSIHDSFGFQAIEEVRFAANAGNTIAQVATPMHNPTAFPPYQSKNHAEKQFAQSTMLMQGLCCIRDVEGGLRFLRRAALQDEPNSMLQYAQVLDDGVLLQRSSSAAAFFLNRAMAAVQEAGDGSLDHLKVIQTSPSHPPT